MNGYALIIRAIVTPALDDRQLTAVSTEIGGTISYDTATSMLRYATNTQDRDGIAALGKTDGTLNRAISRHAGAELETIEARALEWNEYEAETLRPSTPRSGLAGRAEAAEILGVSLQRVNQLRDAHKDFPRPVADLKCGPVWDRTELETWERGWNRKRTGRPQKETQ